MPPVKIVKVLSVNSEDPVHTAQNLLQSDNPKKKWKCKSPGEKQAVAILQLEEASKISGIDVGNECSAFVEILVAKSTSNEDDYKVLLVATSLMSYDESKTGTNINSVKFFNQSHLSKPTVDDRWDRIKIICTQPFNKQVQYGLSFIVVHSKAAEVKEEDRLPNLGKFTWKQTESDNGFSAGSLFTKKKLDGGPLIEDETKVESNAKITKGPSALDDSTETSKGKLNPKADTDSKKRTNIGSASKAKDVDSCSRRSVKNRLIYDDDDDDEEPTRSKNRKKQNDTKNQKGDTSSPSEENSSANKADSKENKVDNKCSPTEASSSGRNDSGKAVLNKPPNDYSTPSTSNSSSTKRKIERKVKNFYELLDDVVFVISGFENPYRGQLRSKALEMGAKYKPDWNPACTHLICAFPNTPKFQQVRGKGKIMKKEWIEECYSKKRRFPWRRFALDKKDKKKPESEDEIFTDLNDVPDESDCDTDEEISRIQRNKKKKAADPFDEDTEDDDGSSQKRPQRKRKKVLSVYDEDTDIDEEEEEKPKQRQNPRDASVTARLPLPYLPDFFSGKSFYISSLVKTPAAKAYLQRCITAYKGTIVLDLVKKIDYVVVDNDYEPQGHRSIELIKENHPDVVIVKQDWIRECSVLGQLVSCDKLGFGVNSRYGHVHHSRCAEHWRLFEKVQFVFRSYGRTKIYLQRPRLCLK